MQINVTAQPLLLDKLLKVALVQWWADGGREGKERGFRKVSFGSCYFLACSDDATLPCASVWVRRKVGKIFCVCVTFLSCH